MSFLSGRDSARILINNTMKVSNQAKIATALILTGILSISSSFIPNSATAAPTNVVPATTTITHTLPRTVKRAVLRDISRKNNIQISKLKITTFTQQTWGDGCLGLGTLQELCTQAIVPGWIVTATDGNQTWTYHTNSNGRGIRLANTNPVSTIKPVPIATNELPPKLDKDIVFRAIATGGIIGRTYQTILLQDGRLIQTRIGDANDSDRRIYRVSPQKVQQFQQLLQQQQAQFQNINYPTLVGADYMTYTLSSNDGTVQYNDLTQNHLPKSLRIIIQTWNQLKS
jgi:hypothetical protein